MAQAFDRFELVRKGYDPQAVEQQLRLLNSELVRLNELTTELQTQLKNTRAQLASSEAAVAAANSPNFAALGAKAATILSSAQQIAAELELDAKNVAQQILEDAKSQSERLAQQSEANYDSVVEDGKRRAQRKIAEAEIEAKAITAKAAEQSEKLLRHTELEIARERGMAATEVAAIRTTAKREAEARKVELEAKYAAMLNLLLADNMTGSEKLSQKEKAQLEAVLTERRSEAEAEYLEKHLAAVSATQSYLNSAKEDLSALSSAAANLRLEIETLELEASMTQRRILQEARDKSDALIRAAEIEARNLVAAATETTYLKEQQSKEILNNLQNQAASVEIYLENLRSLVTDGLVSKGNDGTEN